MFLALLELYSDVSHLFLACLKLLGEVDVVASHLCLRRLKIFGEVRVVASHFLRRFEMLGYFRIVADLIVAARQDR